MKKIDVLYDHESIGSVISGCLVSLVFHWWLLVVIGALCVFLWNGG